jgi:hypothetical protein
MEPSSWLILIELIAQFMQGESFGIKILAIISKLERYWGKTTHYPLYFFGIVANRDESRAETDGTE